MSKQRECIVLEAEPNQWYCIVATGEFGRITNDPNGWQPTTYGPKPTADDAYNLMREYEANPGGYTQYANNRMTDELRALLQRFPPGPLPTRLSDLPQNMQGPILKAFLNMLYN